MATGFLGDYDVWGRKKSKKQKKREVLADNRDRGRRAEDLAAMQYSIRGYEVERTGRGHDFRVRRRNPFTGRVAESKLVEVKSSRRAPLSKLQKKTKRKKSNYKVERVNPDFLL